MSNFTKSIVYSGTVLVAGLIAVFTIYNNMTTQGGPDFASIEPAAGEERVEGNSVNFIQTISEVTESAMDATQEMAADAGETAMDTMSDAAEAAEGLANDAGEAVSDAAEAGMEKAEEMANEASEAAQDAATSAMEAMEPASGEQVQDAAETAKGMIAE